MSSPPTRYARSGDASIAYQVVGEGPIDLVLVLGFATHVELQWESVAFARFFERIASFSRLILFDKRGTGLSDPVADVPTLEQRVDDVRAVMDAAGSERAAMFGISEGGPMSVMVAATHPDRVAALILYGAMGRTTEAPDYPWASPADALRESADEFIAPYWGTDAQGTVELFAPSFADDAEVVEFAARMERSAASPGMVRKIFEMFLDMDVRAVLPTIHVPTLVLHRRGDRVVNWRAGEELARQIPGALYIELEGIDHQPWAGDWTAVLGEIEEFLTGARSEPEPDRVLTTVMFTDIVGSTEQAAELGDARWRELLSAHQDAVRRELARSGGREVKTLGRSAGAHRPALRRGRADRQRRGRHRGPHRITDRSDRGRRRGAGLQHRKGPRRRLGDSVRRPRNAAAQRHLRRMATVQRRAVTRPASRPAACLSSDRTTC
jgi:pimeloyl-ACP methyl ester carboxylesterase